MELLEAFRILGLESDSDIKTVSQQYIRLKTANFDNDELCERYKEARLFLFNNLSNSNKDKQEKQEAKPAQTQPQPQPVQESKTEPGAVIPVVTAVKDSKEEDSNPAGQTEDSKPAGQTEDSNSAAPKAKSKPDRNVLFPAVLLGAALLFLVIFIIFNLLRFS